MTLLAIAMTALSIVVAGPISKILSHGEITAPRSLYIWLGIFAVTSAATAPLMALFAGTGGAKYRARMSAICAGVNVALSFGLAHVYGAAGPAISSTISLILLSIILLIRTKRIPQSLIERH